jgi:hypothetical protein
MLLSEVIAPQYIVSAEHPAINEHTASVIRTQKYIVWAERTAH